MGAAAASASDSVSKDEHPSPSIAIYGDRVYDVIREGAADILNLQRSEDVNSKKNGSSKPQSVFYNPIQQYNRDLSVLAIKAFGEDLAAVRRARQQRRIEQLAKNERRSKKRKRQSTEGEREDEQSRANRSEAEESKDDENCETQKKQQHAPSIAIEGDKDGTDTVMADATTSHFDIEGPNATEKPQASAENGQVEKNGEQTKERPNEPPKGPKSVQVPFRILDALSATGLRALRYAKEIPMVTSVTANDLSTSATASIQLNAEHNKLTDKVFPNTSDAIEHMHYSASSRQRHVGLYQVIDLDPYGTAAPFLDAAVQAIVDGGLICVTCTDAGVFASVGYLEKTYSQYGGLPIKGPHAHEAGLRLILHAIATSAARYGLAIEPLLSLSIDFYARVFVRIRRSPAEVKFLASKTMNVYSCDSGCGAWSTQYLARSNKKQAKNGDTIYTFTSAVAPTTGTHCDHCGFRTHQAGPMWGGPLHNPHFVQRILDMLPTLDKSVYGTIPRIEGMLSVALNEFLDDAPPTPSTSDTIHQPFPANDPAMRCHSPFFFLPSSLSRILHCVSPSDAAVRGALRRLGYRASRSHTKAGSICTDAPWNIIWEIMREWVRQKSPIKADAVKERTAGWEIMQKDRSRLQWSQVKEMFKQVIDNMALKDTSESKRDMEAALLARLEEGVEKKSEAESMTEDGMALPGNPGQDQHQGSGVEEKAKPKQDVGSEGFNERGNHNASTIVDTSRLKIVFDEELGKELQEKDLQGKRKVRYQVNPRADWGPMNRAKGDN